jgi:hypothetical protein
VYCDVVYPGTCCEQSCVYIHYAPTFSADTPRGATRTSTQEGALRFRVPPGPDSLGPGRRPSVARGQLESARAGKSLALAAEACAWPGTVTLSVVPSLLRSEGLCKICEYASVTPRPPVYSWMVGVVCLLSESDKTSYSASEPAEPEPAFGRLGLGRWCQSDRDGHTARPGPSDSPEADSETSHILGNCESESELVN